MYFKMRSTICFVCFISTIASFQLKNINTNINTYNNIISKNIKTVLATIAVTLSITSDINVNINGFNHINNENSMYSNNNENINENVNDIFSLRPAAVYAQRGEDVKPDDAGANEAGATKIRGGGASTLQRGIVKTMTRGVNLDKSDFSGANLKGVAFQQSIVRYCNFKGANLYSSSFFDATLDGSDFENADMTQANIELAQLKNCNLKNTVAREMYVVGTTLFEGIGSIENSDWTDTDLSKYQRKYLCALPSATGKNTVTGEDTRESLRCD